MKSKMVFLFVLTGFLCSQNYNYSEDAKISWKDDAYFNSVKDLRDRRLLPELVGEKNSGNRNYVKERIVRDEDLLIVVSMLLEKIDDMEKQINTLNSKLNQYVREDELFNKLDINGYLSEGEMDDKYVIKVELPAYFDKKEKKLVEIINSNYKKLEKKLEHDFVTATDLKNKIENLNVELREEYVSKPSYDTNYNKINKKFTQLTSDIKYINKTIENKLVWKDASDNFLTETRFEKKITDLKNEFVVKKSIDMMKNEFRKQYVNKDDMDNKYKEIEKNLAKIYVTNIDFNDKVENLNDDFKTLQIQSFELQSGHDKLETNIKDLYKKIDSIEYNFVRQSSLREQLENKTEELSNIFISKRNYEENKNKMENIIKDEIKPRITGNLNMVNLITERINEVKESNKKLQKELEALREECLEKDSDD